VIEAPKISSIGFYPAVFRPLTLVPIKRVSGYPSRMRSAISWLSCNALTVIKFNCATSNNNRDFRRNSRWISRNLAIPKQWNYGLRYEVWTPNKRISFVQSSLAIRKCHQAHKRLQIPQVSCLPLFQPIVRLPGKTLN
jgi:hypothetical protein